MSHAVNWFQIQGPDGHSLQSFYKKVFDWPLSPMPGSGDMMMIPAQPPDGIPGGVGTSLNKQPNVAVYVSVGDIDAYLGKVERAGGHMAMPKIDLPNAMGAIAGFTDPAGNWIGLWQPAAKPAAPTRKAASGVKPVATKAAAPKKASAALKKAPKKASTAPKKAPPKKAAAKTKAKR